MQYRSRPGTRRRPLVAALALLYVCGLVGTYLHFAAVTHHDHHHEHDCGHDGAVPTPLVMIPAAPSGVDGELSGTDAPIDACCHQFHDALPIGSHAASVKAQNSSTSYRSLLTVDNGSPDPERPSARHTDPRFVSRLLAGVCTTIAGRAPPLRLHA